MKEINLIAGEEKKFVELNVWGKRLGKAAVITLLVFILISAAVLSFLFFFDRKFKDNEKNIQGLKNAIRSFDKIESYLMVVSDRIAGIEKIKKASISNASLVNDFSSLFIPGFIFKTISFGAGSIKIASSCDNNQSLSNFYEKLETLKKSKKFSDVMISSVSRGENGQYDISFELIQWKKT